MNKRTNQFKTCQRIFVTALLFILVTSPHYASLAYLPANPGSQARVALAAAPHRPNDFTALAAASSLEGWLTTLWRDPINGSAAPAYFLTTASGERFPLDFSLQPSNAPEYLALSQYVRVRGIWNTERSTFQIAQIQESNQPAITEFAADPDHPSWIIEDGHIIGNTPWITVLCKFSDVSAEPQSLAFFQSQYNNTYPGLDHYWREASDDHLTLAGSAVSGWHTLPGTAASYYTQDGYFDTTRAFNDCIAAADSQVDFSAYFGVNLMFNALIGYYAAGYGSCGFYELEGENRAAGVTWTFPSVYGDLAILTHEMGHGYCLGHSYVNQDSYPYNNAWDVMSNDRYNCTYHPIFGCLPQHTLAENKHMRGWVDEAQTITINTPTLQTISLERTAEPLGQDPRLVRIYLDDLMYYTLETRMQVSYDQKLPGDAVIIHRYDYAPRLIDLDNDGDSADESAMWQVGETFIDSFYPITFTVASSTVSAFQIELEVGQMPTFVNCASQSFIPASECEALLAFYASTDGENWQEHPGWLDNTNPCNWNGVVCSGGHVAMLVFYSDLNGSIPPEIADLSYLSWLILQSNYLVGEIPSSLGNLTNLTFLELVASLSGDLPSSLGNLANLNTLRIGLTNIDGPIPPELGNLDKLAQLSLNSNKLTGSIPSELGSLESLKGLGLSDNQLEGSIPAAIGDLSNLEVLHLGQNKLSGEVPVSLLQLTKLINIFLDYNAVKATDPDVHTLLDTLNPGWETKQTYPPAGFTGFLSALTKFYLRWDFSFNYLLPGYFEISYADPADWVWHVYGHTEDTWATAYQIADLDASHPYAFRIRTLTLPHQFNQNEVWSEYSPIIELDPSQFSFTFLPVILR